VGLFRRPRSEEVAEADPSQKLGADPIGDDVDYLTTILSRVAVCAERPCAKWQVHHLEDGVRDSDGVDVGRRGCGETLLNLVGKACICPRVVVCSSRGVTRDTCILEVVGSRA